MIKKRFVDGETVWDVRVHMRKGNRDVNRKRQGLGSYREAKAAERALYAELGQAKDATEPVTFGQACEAWATDPETANIYSPGTIERYSYSLEKGVGNDWALKPISEITETLILTWLDQYCAARKVSQNTKAYQRKLISCVLEFSRRKGWVGVNVARDIRIKERRRDLPTWSKEQLEQFLAGVRKIDLNWWSVFTLAALTGMRAGELTALRWRDIDLVGNTILVNRSYDWRTGTEKEFPKSGYSRRIPINANLRTVLLKLKPGQHYVLPRLPELLGSTQSCVLRSHARILGLPEIRFHDLRGIFAQQLALSGTPTHVIMAICGWKSLSTAQRYMRLSGSELRGATDNLKINV